MLELVPNSIEYGDKNLIISQAQRKRIMAGVIQERPKEEKPTEGLTIPKGGITIARKSLHGID